LSRPSENEDQEKFDDLLNESPQDSAHLELT
jgi:hypothetical protein